MSLCHQRLYSEQKNHRLRKSVKIVIGEEIQTIYLPGIYAVLFDPAYSHEVKSMDMF